MGPGTTHPLKFFALPPLFDPEEATTVVEPFGANDGW